MDIARVALKEEARAEVAALKEALAEARAGPPGDFDVARMDAAKAWETVSKFEARFKNV